MNPRRNVALKVAREGMEFLELHDILDKSLDGTGRVGVQLPSNFRLSKVQPNNFFEAATFADKEILGLTSTV